ncbi:hypothetical protein [Salinispora tropica]|uniref:hypothetical protein n=1 Tax=Salinispora tropica TaxID=168695 RepID=UPI0002E93E71|nr:hypothetical protein [Salinispora tropica]
MPDPQGLPSLGRINGCPEYATEVLVRQPPLEIVLVNCGGREAAPPAPAPAEHHTA